MTTGWRRIRACIPGAVITTLRMPHRMTGPAFAQVEHDLAGAVQALPANSDVGAAHQGFVVAGMAAGVAHLRAHGVIVQGKPTTMQAGPTEALTWVCVLAPWRMPLGLVI